MSTNPYDGFETGAPARRPKSRLWMGLGLGCGCLLLVCCGGGGGIIYSVANKYSDDPGDVRDVAQQIAILEIPAELQPQSSFDYIKFFGNSFAFAFFKGPQAGDVLLLMDVSEPYPPANARETRRAFEGAVPEMQKDDDFVVTSSREIKPEIRGREATFTIETGKPRGGNEEYVRVEGSFATASGTGILVLQLPQAKYSEDDVETIIRSIR